ncbi:MAG: PilZ domain-containing protein [Gammaproteobacteria bacterium]|nr:MAG: PilZ domain-containing protein [Gammaproteobacteria bacterium]
MRSVTGTPERRRARRYPFVEMRSQVILRTGLFGKTQVPVIPVDLSAGGLAFDSPVELEVGERITLDLEVNMDMGQFRLEKLVGHVVHRTRKGSVWHCGLAFDIGKLKSGQYTQIMRIIGLIARTESLADRIQQQAR